MAKGRATTPKTVALATMKGGSGKSTLAVCLAAAWAGAGERVTLIDGDRQRSVTRWRAAGEALATIPLVETDPHGVPEAVRLALADGATRVVVDTPGFRAAGMEDALSRADAILVPLKPSPVDFEVAADTVELITGLSHPPPHRFLLTQSVRDSVVARHMRSEMIAAGYTLLVAEMLHRVVYPEAALMGATPMTTAPRGGAARDIEAIRAEVDALLANPV
ncbi:MAG: ParA family protein [Rhodospirillum sp.]|nr:ParA family protein [Rhodospirillum sp.]MCF8491104.1 ParA family protein [Rhodospirillum sp.]MCF8502798.1 ParA family protein [Rhodospirillum sp.]